MYGHLAYFEFQEFLVWCCHYEFEKSELANIKLHQKVEFKLRDIFNKHVIDKTKAFMEF